MKKLNRIVAVLLVVSLMAMVIMPVAAQRQAAPITLPVTQTLPGGGTFEGVLTITEFGVNQAGQLLVTGTLEGVATSATGVVTEITQSFTDIVASLLGGSAGRCTILTLDLGPLFLDLLGLELDLSPINLDLTAVSGTGNLLGNLLCAVAGLLDGNGPLTGIQNLLNRINRLLG